MIPYEELVVALQTWRAKQGLPVGQLSGALTPPPPAVVAPPPPQRAGPPGKPPKMGSTGPQQAFGDNVAPPPPLAAPDDSLDVDEAALIEEAHYENEGDDFAMNFAGRAPVTDDGEATSIGNAPDPRGSGSTLDDGDVPPPSNRHRNDDW